MGLTTGGLRLWRAADSLASHIAPQVPSAHRTPSPTLLTTDTQRQHSRNASSEQGQRAVPRPVPCTNGDCVEHTMHRARALATHQCAAHRDKHWSRANDLLLLALAPAPSAALALPSSHNVLARTGFSRGKELVTNYFGVSRVTVPRKKRSHSKKEPKTVNIIAARHTSNELRSVRA